MKVHHSHTCIRTPVWPIPTSCSVQGLPPDTTEADVAEHFGSIGVLKQDKKTKRPKIWLYRDKENGDLKGDGTVSYEDPFSAASAVTWFNGKEFKGVKSSLVYVRPGHQG